MQRLKLFIPLLVFAVLSVFLLRGLSLDPRALPSELVGKPLPDFDMPILANESQRLSRNEVIGEYTLVNVWATWCPSCHVEHPFLLHLARDMGVRILGVNYKDESVKARALLAEKGNPYFANIVDVDGHYGIQLGITGAPETFLVDPSGTVLLRYQGPVDQQVWDTKFLPAMGVPVVSGERG